MEFSTKVIEAVAKMLAEELEKVETGDQGIMGVENNVREIMNAIGAQTISRYLSRGEPGRRKRHGSMRVWWKSEIPLLA